MNIRRIIYITNARLPTEKAHGIATMKLAAAFAEQGMEIVVAHPWRINRLHDDPFAYYDIKTRFTLKQIPSLDFLWLGFLEPLWFWIQLFSFSFLAVAWLCIRYSKKELQETLVFSHDHIPLFFASFIAPYVFYDVHDYPAQNIFFRRVLTRAIGVAVQTRWKEEHLARDFSVAGGVMYWPNGTDRERFQIVGGREQARSELKLSSDKTIILYSGSLQHWKGVQMLIGVANMLSDDKTVYVVGGAREEVKRLSRKHASLIQRKKLVFVGERPWKEIPLWLASADILVLPNTGQENISNYYTSPLKLFEYMASSRPIVASNIPSIREIVDENSVFFAEADNTASFTAVIEKALLAPEEALTKARHAEEIVRRFTWEARATRILDFIRTRKPENIRT